MAYLGTRKRTRHAANPSDQLTDLTSEPLLSPSPEGQDKRRRISPSIERSPSPDALIELRAQEKALRKANRDEEFARLQKSVAELLKDSKPAVDDEDDQGTDPRLTPLIARFSAVKVKYLRQILNNKFDPINISRLCNDVTINRAYQAKYVDLGKNIEVKMKEDDASEFDIRGLAILMRGLLVYFQIQLQFTEDENVRSLGAAYAVYQSRLCKHHSIYTWELVRSFHIAFH